jgi:hypothetical protein
MVFQLIWGRTKGIYYIPAGARNTPGIWKNCRIDTVAVHVEQRELSPGDVAHRIGFFIGTGKGPRTFKTSGAAGEFFKGLVVMDGKQTIGLD